MFCARVVVPNENGLHARPAAELVIFCRRFSSTVELARGDTVINAKSIVRLLAGGFGQYTELELIVRGDDEDTAGPAIAERIQSLRDW